MNNFWINESLMMHSKRVSPSGFETLEARKGFQSVSGARRSSSGSSKIFACIYLFLSAFTFRLNDLPTHGNSTARERERERTRKNLLGPAKRMISCIYVKAFSFHYVPGLNASLRLLLPVEKAFESLNNGCLKNAWRSEAGRLIRKKNCLQNKWMFVYKLWLVFTNISLLF